MYVFYLIYGRSGSGWKGEETVGYWTKKNQELKKAKQNREELLKTHRKLREDKKKLEQDWNKTLDIVRETKEYRAYINLQHDCELWAFNQAQKKSEAKSE